MGFAVVSPNSKFEEIDKKLAKIENEVENLKDSHNDELQTLKAQTSAIIRAKCVTMTRKDIQLSGLPCDLR